MFELVMPNRNCAISTIYKFVTDCLFQHLLTSKYSVLLLIIKYNHIETGESQISHLTTPICHLILNKYNHAGIMKNTMRRESS